MSRIQGSQGIPPSGGWVRMFDNWFHARIQRPLHWVARHLVAWNITPTKVSIFGFVVGLLAIPALWLGEPAWAVGAIVVNRLMDALDGAIARWADVSTASGRFLETTLDSLFYAAMLAAVFFMYVSVPMPAIITLMLGVAALSIGARAFHATAPALNARTRSRSRSVARFSGLFGHIALTCFLSAVCLYPEHATVMTWSGGALTLLAAFIQVVVGYNSLNRAEHGFKAPLTLVRDDAGARRPPMVTGSSTAPSTPVSSAPAPRVVCLTRKRAQQMKEQSGGEQASRRIDSDSARVLDFPQR
ncbi:CDP-alcohol phosphatidyltransferase family protein [Larsenimonas rhizosphaerae]|uniref:CDP-alcohol phosphatidyltransferase family protein n=1 Tax=Larsenimonas rhizosphaerae TaxID=2944682 RepID=A0AA41ZKK6_9GAMM|nr:CDP-alcohol phosphatidyltransferase family protein [Larsenimonas rhizosphaerae]MCM2131016.1 CDP-alcohol phosphatidyltransferase family protein [Larsenimonas rhizosphaerae]MCX2523721.1 CDP-alcohol phosphatidyltransferase family protein [Larsenimonas rhizosphaerae]